MYFTVGYPSAFLWAPKKVLGSLSRAPFKRGPQNDYIGLNWKYVGLWGFPIGPWYGPLPSEKGSEL